MANNAPRPFTVEAFMLGAERGLETRTARGDIWLARFEHRVLWLARNRKLARTANAIAAQLREPPFSLTLSLGGTLTKEAVRDGFIRLGIDRPLIEKLRKRAINEADRMGVVEPHLLIFQLWHEWQHHEAVNHFVRGLSFADRKKRAFTFKPVHPSKWRMPKSEHSMMLGMMGPPPWARLAQALFGIIDPKSEDRRETAQREKERDARMAKAQAAGEVYAGHYDDPVDILAYLVEIGDAEPTVFFGEPGYLPPVPEALA